MLQYVAAISKFIPQTESRAKIIRLNKSISSTGIFKKFEDADLIESARIAYYEGIPDFIINSVSTDWVEYPLKEYIGKTYSVSYIQPVEYAYS